MTEHQVESRGGEDDNVLRFLDSVDGYLTSLDSLSSTLRQGWMDLASARHSMGAWRVNGTLLDLKPHSASTSVIVSQDDPPVLHLISDLRIANSKEKQPHFVLDKWDSLGDQIHKKKSVEDEFEGKLDGLRQRHHRNNQLPANASQEEEEEKISANAGPLKVDDQVQKERSKPLSMFGALVSPKLRTAQLSFETALEILVEIANMRSAMLSSFDQVHNELVCNT